MTINKINAAQALDGPWHILHDPGNTGKKERWFKAIPGRAKPAPVPGIIQQVFPDCHGVAWYWIKFQTILKKNPGSSYAVKFHEVDYYADIWLNGALLGSHEGAEFAFEVGCGKALKFSGENLLAVRVINPVEEPIDGFAIEDIAHRFKFSKQYMAGTMYNFGGITQAVELVENNPVRITDVHARADIDKNCIKASVTIRNSHKSNAKCRLSATVTLRNSDKPMTSCSLSIEAPCGESSHQLTMPVAQPRWWSPDDPQFYLVTVEIDAGAGTRSCRDQKTVRCGFRELRVEKGYFRLNGKRVLLRCTMTLADYCFGEKIPDKRLRRDLLFAKAAGFNMIRFIVGGASPEQINLCDEIGLMVYEESYASWYMSDPRLRTKYSDLSKMPDRYDRSMLGLVKRDRNHPSVVIWGLLNETFDGPVFRHAYNCLGKLRALDDSRLVILNSGRWDGIISVGSISNPKSTKWEPAWGKETGGGLPALEVDARGKGEVAFVWNDPLGRAERMVLGDFHKYPPVPYRKQDRDFFRTHASGAKPVFLSEYGAGSLLDVINGLRQYRRTDSQVEPVNAAFLRKQAEFFLADWHRFGMNGVYPLPEDIFIDSYHQQARQLRLGFDLIRSNPNYCGSSVLCLEDTNTGQGFWTFWRELKPGMLETLREGWAPLRWCLFVEPLHVYAGRPFEVEAVLANEDILKPGTYPARLKISGPAGTVWEKKIDFSIPRPARNCDGPLAVKVLRQSVKLDLPPGVYEFTASLERGGAPAGGRRRFYVSDVPANPVKSHVTLLGIEPKAAEWLKSRGITCRPFDASGRVETETVLAGDLSKTGTGLKDWREILERTATGSTAIFLSPAAFKRGEDPAGWLPLVKKGRCYRFHDWVYHKECVAKEHPVFEGLQGKGVMNWDYYDQLIPRYVFDGQDTPDDIAAVSFATGYQDGSVRETFRLGYASGILFAGYQFGHGRFFINTFPVLENLAANPAADRMLLNIIRYAQNDAGKTPDALPDNFNSLLDKLYKN